MRTAIKIVFTSDQAGGPQHFTATAPDGGQEITYLGGVSDGLTTLVVKPSGERTQYGYRNNRPYLAQYPTGVTPGGETNPYIAVEIHSVARAGAPVSSAVTTHTIDKNGNPIIDTSYDWIPYSSISEDGNGFPTWPSGTVLRSTTRTLRDLPITSATSGAGVGGFAQNSYDAHGKT